MQGIVLFICCLLLGILTRLAFVGLVKIRQKVGRPAAITLEFFGVGLLAAAFLVIMFFLSDGVFMPFTFFAGVIGFVATSIFI